MSDALPLPPRPTVEQYRKLAKDFQHACESGNSKAIRDWAARWAENISPERLEHQWLRLKKATERCTLADAQLFVARAHGFARWPKFLKHLQALARDLSPVSTFEAAVDAIVAGDKDVLAKLLAAHPALARARSTREHRSTLLHYVSANGVEDFRQKTPGNIVEIARLLLNAGADVNAESDAYGGRSTTLGLTATSCHPEKAGVQIPLLQLLIERGAAVDGPDGVSVVNSCLANGRGTAAEFLAVHGARLDLEGAAGVGRLDIVQSFFNTDGTMKPSATSEQMKNGFAWACEFGRTEVVEFLLDHGLDAGAALRHGQTGLHWAAFAGQVAIVELLLKRHAPLNAKEDSHGATPLGWAIYAREHDAGLVQPHRFDLVVSLLIAAGAKVEADDAAS